MTRRRTRPKFYELAYVRADGIIRKSKIPIECAFAAARGVARDCTGDVSLLGPTATAHFSANGTVKVHFGTGSGREGEVHEYAANGQVVL